MTDRPQALRLELVTKTFPGVTALKEFSFDLRAGEVHVLLGENGAGKSTLISIISGAQRPSSGQILLNDKPVAFNGVAEAKALGISAIYQEFSLVPELTVTENIFLGQEIKGRFGLAKKLMRRNAARILNDLGFDIDPDTPISLLSRAQQQMVEIAKGFREGQRIIIFDEPTASLSDSESERLFELINNLRDRGVGVIYITHRMLEVERLADRVTIMRDGRFVATVERAATHRDELIKLMTGREATNFYPPRTSTFGAEVLHVASLSGHGFEDVAFTLRAGEVVGIAGLVGCGKSEVGRALVGLMPIREGQIAFDGLDIRNHTIAQRKKAGIYYLPSDRKREGLVLSHGARFNISIRSGNLAGAGHLGYVSSQRESATALQVSKKVDLRPLDIERPMAVFSGGNQQKVLFAKALAGRLRLLILDEPTVGVDVNARAAIYRIVADLAAQGVAVVMISSDLSEILNLCHRVHVMCAGRIAPSLSGEEITEQNVLGRMFAN